MTQIQARPTPTVWQPSMDLHPLTEDHVARMDAAGVAADEDMIAALDVLAWTIQTIGLAKFLAVWPFIGATGPTHALDLMDAFDVTWAGTLTHSASGVQGNGSSGYGDTGFSAGDLPGNWAMHAYTNIVASQSAPAIGWLAFGTNQNAGIFNSTFPIHSVYSGRWEVGGVNDRCHVTSEASSGMVSGVRNSATDLRLYRNGVQTQVYTTTQSVGTPAGNALILRRAAVYSAARLGFVAIGTNLSAPEVATLNKGVQRAQQILGRAV